MSSSAFPSKGNSCLKSAVTSCLKEGGGWGQLVSTDLLAWVDRLWPFLKLLLDTPKSLTFIVDDGCVYIYMISQFSRMKCGNALSSNVDLCKTRVKVSQYC